jgi:hypothetical protein
MSGDSKRQVLGTSGVTRKYQLTIAKKARDKFEPDEGGSNTVH